VELDADCGCHETRGAPPDRLHHGIGASICCMVAGHIPRGSLRRPCLQRVRCGPPCQIKWLGWLEGPNAQPDSRTPSRIFTTAGYGLCRAGGGGCERGRSVRGKRASKRAPRHKLQYGRTFIVKSLRRAASMARVLLLLHREDQKRMGQRIQRTTRARITNGRKITFEHRAVA
jgi:hypothetical protein